MMFSKDHIDIRRDWIQEAMAEILVSKDGQNKHLEKNKFLNYHKSLPLNAGAMVTFSYLFLRYRFSSVNAYYLRLEKS